jgi:hypothetical protein
MEALGGFLIYPGGMTVVDPFCAGRIGRLGETEMRGVLEAISASLADKAAQPSAGSRGSTVPQWPETREE